MDASSVPQLPFKSVIYATDFSASSRNAGRYAALLAGRFGAKLLVAHAFVLSQAAMELESETQPAQESQQRLDLERALTETVQRLAADAASARPILLEGDPRELIPQLAEENQPALIVLGTSGRGRVERGLVGSDAERILRVASGPSLTVGPFVPPLDADTVPFRHILYATSLSPAAARGAAYAVAMAAAFNASMDVLHVVPDGDHGSSEQWSEIQQRMATALESLVPEQAREFLHPQSVVEAGMAHTRILEYIQQHSVDLLVLALHKSSHLWLQSRLSGAFHIIANAPCPVLTVTG